MLAILGLQMSQHTYTCLLTKCLLLLLRMNLESQSNLTKTNIPTIFPIQLRVKQKHNLHTLRQQADTGSVGIHNKFIHYHIFPAQVRTSFPVRSHSNCFTGNK